MADWITQLIDQHGYPAVALLMFLENVFPPIPSELIMPFAGYVAAEGGINPIGAVLAGSVGSLAGAFAWYAVGYWLGAERLKRFARKHGRWLTISDTEVEQAQKWFDRRGGVAVCIGRLIPAIRSVISAPAGIAHMNVAKFLLWSSIGTVAWTSLLLGLGFWLGNRFGEVEGWLTPVTWTILAFALGGYLYRLYRTRERA
jgi:membrane protein DedA with SNARE-associated domain